MKRSPMPPRKKPMDRGRGFKSTGNSLKRTSLRNTSKKRDQENRERRAMVQALWPDERPACVKPDCGRLADDVHEPLTRARGGSITDPDNALPLCRRHHDDVTREADWAYTYGLLIHSWETTPLTVIASARRRLLAGEEPVEDIAFCYWCRAWLPKEHDCVRLPDEEEEVDAA